MGDRFVGACEAVFAPSAVVDAGAVAAFAALAAMPSDPDARSVAAAKYATVWIRRWEADICDSVVWNEPVESVSRCGCLKIKTQALGYSRWLTLERVTGAVARSFPPTT